MIEAATETQSPVAADHGYVAAFLIGVFAGLRSMTAPAAVARATSSGRLSPPAPLARIGSRPAVVLTSLAAVGELVADKLPFTPNRTDPGGLAARMATGAFSGAVVTSSSGQGARAGALFGAIGGVTGCFVGYAVRKKLTAALSPEGGSARVALGVAVLEDAVTIVGSGWVVSRLVGRK